MMRAVLWLFLHRFGQVSWAWRSASASLRTKVIARSWPLRVLMLLFSNVRISATRSPHRTHPLIYIIYIYVYRRFQICVFYGAIGFIHFVSTVMYVVSSQPCIIFSRGQCSYNFKPERCLILDRPSSKTRSVRVWLSLLLVFSAMLPEITW